MASWYIDNCEDLGKELIKLGSRPLPEVVRVKLHNYEDSTAATLKGLDEFLWDEDTEELTIEHQANMQLIDGGQR